MPIRKHKTNTSYLHFIWIAIALIIGAGPAFLNFVADPYEMFRNGIADKRSAEFAEKAHYPLWKMTHYPSDSSIVILGDSRARSLRDKYWHELGLTGAYNFAYGGGTIPEIHSTFQQIKDNAELTTLVVGIQLRSFDANHKGGMNRVPEAVKVSSSKIGYLKNWSVARTSLNLFLRQNPRLQAVSHTLAQLLSLSAQAAEFGRPGAFPVDELLKPEICFGCELPEDGAYYVPVNRVHKGVNLGLGRGSRWNDQQFAFVNGSRELPPKFQRQVSKNAAADWKNFQFSELYFEMILEMAAWANSDPKRHLIFVIPPTIPEMQATIDTYGLSELSNEFRFRLADLAPVLDFDFPNPLTADLANFSDAYHFNAGVARSIVGEVAMTLPGSSDAVKAMVDKRRSDLECPDKTTLSHNNSPATDRLVASSMCRIWKGN